MERTETTKHGVTLTLNKPLTDESHVAALEAQLGCSLPGDYREFLLGYNGGRPKPGMFQITLKNGKQTNSTVHWFLSIHDGEYSNLHRTIHSLRERIPPTTLPIASDPFGNEVLLALDGERRGKVYFWDHENEPETQPDWSNVDFIADSFDGFLRGLRPAPGP